MSGFGGNGGQGGVFSGTPTSPIKDRTIQTTLKFEARPDAVKLGALNISLIQKSGKTVQLPFKLRDIPLDGTDAAVKPDAATAKPEQNAVPEKKIVIPRL